MLDIIASISYYITVIVSLMFRVSGKFLFFSLPREMSFLRFFKCHSCTLLGVWSDFFTLDFSKIK